MDPVTHQITQLPGVSPEYLMNHIITGPDGSLWFNEFNQDKIARITTSGVVSEFPLPGFPSDPAGVAPGPDGNVWFTDQDGDVVGQITTNGTITEFPLSPSSFPEGIALGPDGNFWIAEGIGRIGRMTTNGTLTDFSAGISTNGLPFSLVAGPDGALWFTELFTNKVGRITTNGVVTEFSLPSLSAASIDLTAGPDGNIWVAEYHTNQIARITPLGVVTEFNLGTNIIAAVRGITVGPDGNIWFTDSANDRIGQIILDKPALAIGATNSAVTTIPFSGIVASFTDPQTSVFRAKAPQAPIAIPDLSTNNSTQPVAGIPIDRVITNVTVTVSIQHTFDSDLVIALFAPDNTRILLSNDRGGSGHGYTNTVFDDQAPVSIASGAAPFTGSFRPEIPLAGLDGKNPNGTWTLQVNDTVSGDFGSLLGWSLSISTVAPTPPSKFTAMINWGDGQSSPGGITSNGAGGFNVIGTHTYLGGSSNYPVSVTITDIDNTHDVGGATTTAIGLISVTGRPTLDIRLLPGAGVLLSWSTNAVGFQLQSAASLAPAVWGLVTNVPVIVGAEYNVTNNVLSNRWYRLIK